MIVEAPHHTTLHRTAKYFMDTGKAASHEEAIGLLQEFGLTVTVGADSAGSFHHEVALLTLVNIARRTFLGGVEVVGVEDRPSISALAQGQSLHAAIRNLGGRVATAPRPQWPKVIIGRPTHAIGIVPAWQLTWGGWRGGVVPVRDGHRLDESKAMSIVPAVAAAVCANEVFAYYAGDHPLAGKRATGLSLWRPGGDWLCHDANEPTVERLPASLWLIGLGNLGQAFAWLLACMQFRDPAEVQLVLQDFDRINVSNESTSILSRLSDVGRRKTRCIAEWLEERKFTTIIEERRFGESTCRGPDEPGVAFCGVDNALARMALEKAGFDLIVEAGLGGGPNAFRSLSLHCFPASRSAQQIWSRHVGQHDEIQFTKPAYEALKKQGVDACGLAQLASRTVGVPFVGVIAASLAVAELLRRLHGGPGIEVLSGSVLALQDLEAVYQDIHAYPGSFLST